MVRATGIWLPYLPPPNFPLPLPPACFDKMSLGSKVDHMMGSGTRAWVTSAPSLADKGFDAQVEVLGAQSVSCNLESRAQVVALRSSVCV